MTKHIHKFVTDKTFIDELYDGSYIVMHCEICGEAIKKKLPRGFTNDSPKE